jgi:large subunit ribosomal protein L9
MGGLVVKIILLQDVKGQGRQGEVKEVSEGYARNFLLPKGLAVEATDAALQQLKRQKDSIQKKQAHELAEAKALAAQLEGREVLLRVQAGEGGRLFGAITTKHIADSLHETGFPVDKKKIVLHDPIKTLGFHDVQVKLHPEVTTTLKIHVQTESV